MRGLVIDTALSMCTVAAFDRFQVVAVRSEPMVKGHQEHLAGFVREVMYEAGFSFSDLDRIGVTVGPGSFTGLRVGLAFAQGLGTALDRPVVGISTLDGLAASVDPDGRQDVAAMIDARRDQVYARFWRAGLAQGPPEPLSLEDVAVRVLALGPGAALVGSGAALLGAASPPVGGLVAPIPDALVRLSVGADPAQTPPRPLYLRAPDASPSTRLPGQPRMPAAG